MPVEALRVLPVIAGAEQEICRSREAARQVFRLCLPLARAGLWRWDMCWWVQEPVEAVGASKKVVKFEMAFALGCAGAALGDQAAELRPAVAGACEGCHGEAGVGDDLCAGDEAWHMGEQMPTLVGDVIRDRWADGAVLRLKLCALFEQTFGLFRLGPGADDAGNGIGVCDGDGGQTKFCRTLHVLLGVGGPGEEGKVGGDRQLCEHIDPLCSYFVLFPMIRVLQMSYPFACVEFAYLKREEDQGVGTFSHVKT